MFDGRRNGIVAVVLRGELECYPLFGFCRRLSRYSDNDVTTGAELPTLIVKIRRCEYQRPAGSDQPP